MVRVARFTRRRSAEELLTAVLVTAAVAFVFFQLQPDLLLSGTIPSGGDMGAHVWGPDFLREHLLSQGRLTGWSPDWYAGFPAYHFYMVVPSLLIVALDVVLSYGVAFKLVSIAGLLALPVAAWALGRLARVPFPGPALLAVGTVPFLFNRTWTIYGGNVASTLAGEFAFSISLALAVLFIGLVLRGLETGRHRAAAAAVLALCALCHIIPALLALAGGAVALALRADRSRLRWAVPVGVVGALLTSFWTVPFVLRRAYLSDMGWTKLTTYWENLLPGRLGRSISQFFGGAADNGGASPLAGDLTLVVALALGGLFMSVMLRRRLGILLGILAAIFAVAFVLVPQGRLWNARLLPFWYLCLYLLAALAVAEAVTSLAAVLSRRPERSQVKFLGTWAVVVLAFVVGRLSSVDAGRARVTAYWENLFPGGFGEWLSGRFGGAADNGGAGEVVGDLTLVALLALAGLTVSVVNRRRPGMFLGLVAVVSALLFVVVPQAWLWNGRLLPIWQLCLYLLAAMAVVEGVAQLAERITSRPRQPSRHLLLGATGMVALVTLVAVGLPLRSLPFGQLSEDGTEYAWATVSTTDHSFVPGWVTWNYSGYQGKDAWPEYQALMSTMDEVGRTHGCGRAMWEYETTFLDRYGTPMAPMLLPSWTDGCIGSMEGLYFEASATTPFHFLNQSELSKTPSSAMRDLPYGSLDVSRGVDHLQLFGVRYYMAFSPEAVAQADAEPELRPVTTSGSWRIYEVADSELVVPLDAEPAVWTDVPKGGKGWLEPAVDWYMDPAAHEVFLAATGPESWQRVEEGERPERRPVDTSAVTDIETDVDRISFEVYRPGTPVLVKTSYFPNWQATGADGPYRVAPNLMVVVPTDTTVELNYRSTPVDWLGGAMTGLGLVALALMASRGRLPMRPDQDGVGGARPPAPAAGAGAGDGGDGTQGDRVPATVGSRALAIRWPPRLRRRPAATVSAPSPSTPGTGRTPEPGL